MKDLSYRNAVAVGSLPTPSANLAGSIVRLTSNNKPYWCSGTSWVDLTETAAVAGINKQVQYNNNGIQAGATNVNIDSNDLMLSTNSTPTIPSAQNIKLFGKTYGTNGRTMVAAMGPSGMDYTLQPGLWRQGISIWKAPGNTTVANTFGMNSLSSVGALTARSISTTNTLTRTKRLGVVSSTTAGKMAALYAAYAQHYISNGSGAGGFFYSCRFGVSDAAILPAARMFVGMQSSVVAPTNTNPGTMSNYIGVGHTNSDTNLYIYYGGTAAQTRINLGVNFPISNSELYDITLWNPPNSTNTIYYYVERVGTTYISNGLVTGGATAIPASTTALAPRAWRTNNTTAAAVGLDLSSIYLETDW